MSKKSLKKNDEDSKFYVMCILPQLTKIVEKVLCWARRVPGNVDARHGGQQGIDSGAFSEFKRKLFIWDEHEPLGSGYGPARMLLLRAVHRPGTWG